MYKKLLSLTTFCLALSASYAYAQSAEQVASQANDNQANTIIQCFNSAKSESAAASCIQKHEQIDKSTLVLFMEIDMSTATSTWLNGISEEIKADLQSTNIAYENINVSDQSLIVTFADEQTLQKAQKYFSRQEPSLPLINRINDVNAYLLTVDAQGIVEFQEKTMQRSIDNYKYRLQQLNMTDVTFLPHGSEQLVLLIPGVTKQTQQQVIEQLGAVDILQFRLVYDGDDARDIIEGKKPAPQNMEQLKTLDDQLLLVDRKALEIQGSDLRNAYATIGQHGGSQINIAFNSKGADLFYDLTRENMHKRLAIVLVNGTTSEQQVLSAPVINEPIAGGRVMISGALCCDEAQRVADSLQNSILIPPMTIKGQCIVEPVQN